MAKQIYVDKSLNISGPSDQYPARVLGVILSDADHPSVVLELIQTAALTALGIAVRPYGLIVIPHMSQETEITLVMRDVLTGEETTLPATALSNIYEGMTIAAAS